MTNRTLYGIDFFLRTGVGKFTQLVFIILTYVSTCILLTYCNYQVMVYSHRLVWMSPASYGVIAMVLCQLWLIVISIFEDLGLMVSVIKKYYCKIFHPGVYVKRSKDLIGTSAILEKLMLNHCDHVGFVVVQLINYFLLASSVCTWVSPFRGKCSENEKYLYASNGMILLFVIQGCVVNMCPILVAKLDSLRNVLVGCYRRVFPGLKKFDDIESTPDSLSIKKQ